MKRFLCLLSILLFTFITTNVYAINISAVGDSINVDGSYESSRFVAGNKVFNSSSVDGLSLIAGNEINTKGTTPYGLYAGNVITIDDNITKDLFVAGNMITINNDASIGRDVYIAGNDITIRSNIERDLRAGGTTVDISGITIKGDAYIDAEQIIMDEETKIEGKLVYSEDSNVIGLNQAVIGSIEVTKIDKVVIEYNFMDTVREFIISSIASFITLIVIFYILPKSKEKLENTDLSVGSIAKSTGIGFLVLITVPIVSLIGLFTGILTPISLIAVVLYIICIYISSLLVYYIVGNVIAKKMNIDNYYLAIVIGIIIVKLVKFVPIVGGLISALSLFYGLGLIFSYITKKDK